MKKNFYTETDRIISSSGKLYSLRALHRFLHYLQSFPADKRLTNSLTNIDRNHLSGKEKFNGSQTTGE